MKEVISILCLVFTVSNAFAQISNVNEAFLLPSNLTESSGAIFFNNKLITHNDSGGENKLYELDINTEQITRTVTITNATNVDWEDITQDATSIYIGDIGNNNGNRTDLKIYKISKADYISSNSITAEIIEYNYADQTDYSSNPNNTIWDAEALVSLDANNLILFTKNWVDGLTKGYVISSTAGIYSVNPLASTLASGGLITGGTFNTLTGKLYLIGYDQTLQPFIWESFNFNSNDVFSGTNTLTPLSDLGQEQAEAITFVDANSYLVTSESFSISVGPFTVSDDAKLISFSTNDTTLSNTSIENLSDVILYPNPASYTLKVKSSNHFFLEIFDTKLKRLYIGNASNIDVSSFSQGIYIVKIHLEPNRILIKKFIKK